jgi:hypothetical protein
MRAESQTMKKILCTVVPLLLAMSLPLHAADRLSMAYDAVATDDPPAVLKGACTVSVGTISDERNNKETAGADNIPLLSGDPIPWVGAAFDNLGAYGYKVMKGDKPANGGIAMNAAIKRSYVYHGPMRINGVIALDALVTLPSGEKVSRKYRALGSKTNMAGTTSEYMTALNYAMNNLLAKVAVDLQTMCGGAPRSATALSK